jgi:phosphoenolpyruvate phosphomutase
VDTLSTEISRPARLRALIESTELEFLIEAHSGVSARIVEEAGFSGIWASSLTISGQLGVRDTNEATWTQILEVVEFMADASSLPILLDGDTGYGDFNITRRLVRKFEQRGGAGLCLEDKIFPKKNSLLEGTSQRLAPVAEFTGKIRAVKDSQHDPDFVMVARTEALITGSGMSEALDRAHAYVDAGADAILIHSAKPTAEEVVAFKRAFGDRAPVVIVPTAYYATPTRIFEDAGFSVAIWANHLLRAAIFAMTRVARKIRQDNSIVTVEDEIVPVSEIFRLQSMDELSEAQRIYLPRETEARATAIVLAAARGSDLGDLTASKPKAMVEIAGRPLLDRIAAALRAAGVNDITVVRGYRKDQITLPDVTLVDNDEYESSGELVSLRCGLAGLPADRNVLVCYGDVLFRTFIVDLLLEADDDFVVAVDSNWEESTNVGRLADYVACNIRCSKSSYFQDVYLTAADPAMDRDLICGEWIGFLKVSASAMGRLRDALDDVLTDGTGPEMRMHKLLGRLLENGERVRVVYTTGCWLDVDTVDDVVNASRVWNVPS